MKFLFSHIYLTYVNTACKPYVSQVSTFFFLYELKVSLEKWSAFNSETTNIWNNQRNEKSTSNKKKTLKFSIQMFQGFIKEKQKQQHTLFLQKSTCIEKAFIFLSPGTARCLNFSVIWSWLYNCFKMENIHILNYPIMSKARIISTILYISIQMTHILDASAQLSPFSFT